MQITHCSTKDFAKYVSVKSATVRRGYCVNGHYLGIKPLRLPNGRLSWPIEEIEKIMGGRS